MMEIYARRSHISRSFESFWAGFSDWTGLDGIEFWYISRNDDKLNYSNIVNRQTIFLKPYSNFDPSRKPAWNEIFMADR